MDGSGDGTGFDWSTFEADLAAFTPQPKTTDPLPEEWEVINDYRLKVEEAYQEYFKDNPEHTAAHDRAVETYIQQLSKDFKLDMRDLRTLWTLAVSAGISVWYVTRSTLNCGAGEQIIGHSIAHIMKGILEFDFVLRDAFISAGAPKPTPQDTAEAEAGG